MLEEDPQLDTGVNFGARHIYSFTSGVTNAVKEENFTDHPISVPAGEIGRLLQKSLVLDLPEEITPVQIWSRVCDLSTQYPTSPAFLQLMAEEFAKYVQCNTYVIRPSYTAKLRATVLVPLSTDRLQKPCLITFTRKRLRRFNETLLRLRNQHEASRVQVHQDSTAVLLFDHTCHNPSQP